MYHHVSNHVEIVIHVHTKAQLHTIASIIISNDVHTSQIKSMFKCFRPITSLYVILIS